MALHSRSVAHTDPCNLSALQANFLLVPERVVRHKILPLLRFPDLAALCRVCRQLNKVASSDEFWEPVARSVPFSLSSRGLHASWRAAVITALRVRDTRNASRDGPSPAQITKSRVKVVMLGDSGVGKTSLLDRCEGSL